MIQYILAKKLLKKDKGVKMKEYKGKCSTQAAMNVNNWVQD